MATSADLTTALTALAAAISTLTTNQNAAAAAPPRPAVHTIVLDPFESNAPFDPSTAGASETTLVIPCPSLSQASPVISVLYA
jgi:hypothetical protein